MTLLSPFTLLSGARRGTPTIALARRRGAMTDRARRNSGRDSGGLGDEREAGGDLPARAMQDLLGEIGAAAADARAAGHALQVIETRRAVRRRCADHLLGYRVADADVHGGRAPEA